MAKVKVAFLGCGGFMGAHAQRLRAHPDVQLVAMCDVAEAGVRGFIQQHLGAVSPAPAVFTDPAAMYAQAKPDAVFIATPHTMHFQHGKQALQAGCHVYMEKPMVTAADDAYALAEVTKKAGKILVVGYNTPCSPEYLWLRESIRNKSLGKLEVISGFLSQDWMRLTVGLWRQKPELSGGGQAYDSGAHLLNSLCWSVESNVAEVFAFVDNHGTPVDINSAFVIRFENGVMASIAIGGNSPGGGSHMAYMFDGGRVEIDPWGSSFMNVFGANGSKVKWPAIPGKDQTPDDNFIDAILGRAEPRTSPANGIIQSELMDAIYESAKTGRPAKPKRRG
ncbi:MAG: Gfo/Idh/MocA family oxidoreductase [Planctomycetota bacterium]|nr:Gfo/Idh/MocA family oxidoreductase [Planctomycetota bacterium]